MSRLRVIRSLLLLMFSGGGWGEPVLSVMSLNKEDGIYNVNVNVNALDLIA